MTDRNKLIELLKQANTLYLDYLESIDQKGLIDTEGRAEYIADYLIANGVIVPPCKVGDIVYAVGDKDGHQIKECRVSCFDFESAEHFVAEVYFDCDCDCDGCYFNAFSQSYCGEWGCDNAYGHSCIPISDFGKTVFLTREEAEKALENYRENT